MPGSSETGNAQIKLWFDEVQDIHSVLDIGPGWGTYVKLLRTGEQEWHALEVFEPYVKKFGLGDLYDRIFVGDMRQFVPPGPYDAIIMGDVLEHVLNFE